MTLSKVFCIVFKHVYHVFDFFLSIDVGVVVWIEQELSLIHLLLKFWCLPINGFYWSIFRLLLLLFLSYSLLSSFQSPRQFHSKRCLLFALGGCFFSLFLVGSLICAYFDVGCTLNLLDRWIKVDWWECRAIDCLLFVFVTICVDIIIVATSWVMLIIEWLM